MSDWIFSLELSGNFRKGVFQLSTSDLNKYPKKKKEIFCLCSTYLEHGTLYKKLEF